MFILITKERFKQNVLYFDILLSDHCLDQDKVYLMIKWISEHVDALSNTSNASSSSYVIIVMPKR